jgi:hypothetical protein
MSADRPSWPFLWVGTLLITIVAAVLMLILRERPNRTAGKVPVDPVAGPDQAVPSRFGPIKIEWVESRRR